MRRTVHPSTEFSPCPVVLVTCGAGEKANIITIAWTGIVCSIPPMVGVAIRPSRHSHRLMLETKEFAVNIPTEDQIRAVDMCGQLSGRNGNKFEATGLTPAAGEKIRVPIIAECPIALECQTRQIVSLGSHDLFIGEIVAVRVDEERLTEEGLLRYDAVSPLLALGGRYWRWGQFLERMGFSQSR